MSKGVRIQKGSLETDFLGGVGGVLENHITQHSKNKQRENNRGLPEKRKDVDTF